MNAKKRKEKRKGKLNKVQYIAECNKFSNKYIAYVLEDSLETEKSMICGN